MAVIFNIFLGSNPIACMHCSNNAVLWMRYRAMQFPPEAWLRMSVNHGSITWISILPSGRVVLRSLGDTGHMPPDAITSAWSILQWNTLSGEISVLKAQIRWDMRGDYQLYLPLYVWISSLIYQSPLNLLQNRAIQSWSHWLHVAPVELHQSSRYWH
jgi:hypothetical protein